MKVLIIGEADSVWVKSIIERTFLPYGDIVSILSLKNSKFKEFYDNHSVRVIKRKEVKGNIIANQLSNIIALVNRYDLICVHFVMKNSAFLGRIGSYFSSRYIMTFWGSDILRKKTPDPVVLKSLKCASYITLSTSEMKSHFQSIYGHAFDSKIVDTHFGSNVIDEINAISIDSEGLRDKYHIQKDKVVISIGYNKMPEQQHKKVLKAIQALDSNARNRIHLILRLTYGKGDISYIDEVKQELELTGCSSSIFESFLSDKEVAEITNLTDIFVHAQTTDARSASMCEHLYSRCLVLNPSWIKYSDLEEKVFYLQFDDFDEIAVIIKNNLCLKEDSVHYEKLSANSEKIYSLCSWECFASDWRKIYNGG